MPRIAGSARRLVYFPGSTIGNLTPPESIALLHRTANLAGRGGALLLGVDLEKDKHSLEAAYNDSKGVTAAFNRNILLRINRELGANFVPEHFSHNAPYNSAKGRIEMHLVSTRRQRVRIGTAEFSIGAGESICTEYSHKYRLSGLRALSAAAGFEVQQIWTDQRHRFAVMLLRVQPGSALALDFGEHKRMEPGVYSFRYSSNQAMASF
jgi:dimethylhistidine N-methyltransferase